MFLPGAGGDPAFWRPVGDRLPADWDKVYFGWPGLGDQPPDPDVRDFDDLTALVEAQLGDAPVDILAQSMGGAIAIVLALRHPARVRRLVLSVTSAPSPPCCYGATPIRSVRSRSATICGRICRTRGCMCWGAAITIWSGSARMRSRL